MMKEKSRQVVRNVLIRQINNDDSIHKTNFKIIINTVSIDDGGVLSLFQTTMVRPGSCLL